MNRNYHILSGALLLLVSGVCFQSCQQDDWEESRPDIETLIAEGRYLTARSEDASVLASDTEEPKLFEVGTPYRLLAFTKPYKANEAYNSGNTVNYPRFNKVAWEGATPDGLRFINISGDPDKWFGFSALKEGEKVEEGGDDGLVSLDFYGFTYGKKPESDRDPNYIKLYNGDTEIEGEETPSSGTLSSLNHREEVAGNGELKDLMRGVLLNQNIKTAGKSQDGESSTWTDNAYTQSVIPFKHCFSKLRFQISQQGDEDSKDTDGNPIPSFENLYVDKIEVINTYGSGKVYLQDGKISLTNECDRNLTFLDGYKGEVTVKNTDVGEMIIFPSDGDALKSDMGMSDGYDVGLSISVRSTVREDIENMVKNTNDTSDTNNTGDTSDTNNTNSGITEEIIDETTWYKGTIVKKNIVDYYNTEGTDKEVHLRFKQNTSYMLIITFQKEGVRIITVIPQVEEWLPGEETAVENGTIPWQEQAMGQPQMFDNVVWSDRNLGATHYDPSGNGGENFENTVGYFYQAGRNIPYYPFDPADGVPDFSQMNKQNLKDKDTRWSNAAEWGSPYRLYPIVDSRILNMSGSEDWTINPWQTPQMYIPEESEEKGYFDFMKWNHDGDDFTKYDMVWNDGQAKQPVSGSWIVPSSKDFLTIFPSTPHAGNIVFNKVEGRTLPLDWGIRNDYDINDVSYQISATDILRVTVPYYVAGSENPARNDTEYKNAWQKLKENHDEGTTHRDCYGAWGGGEPGYSTKYEPNGDPEDGYASVYIISLKDEDKTALSDNLKGQFQVKEWGTIYGIKRIYTPQAYRMRWRAKIANEGSRNPSLYLEICRYRCKPDARLTEENYQTYDWDHPAATIYFPICGLGDHTGQYINYGTECQYATSDIIQNGKVSSVQIKITGNNAANAYIAVIKDQAKRNFGMQIRPIGGVNSSK